jgi:hypothetical protein
VVFESWDASPMSRCSLKTPIQEETGSQLAAGNEDQRVMRAKSLINKYFTCKSFILKDFAEFFV